MNKKQEEALRELEKVFKKCTKAGIVFCGIDGSLYAIDSDEFNKGRGESYRAASEFMKDIEYHIVKNIDYLDSGGF